MARWTITRKCFWDGVLHHVGDEVEARQRRGRS